VVQERSLEQKQTDKKLNTTKSKRHKIQQNKNNPGSFASATT